MKKNHKKGFTLAELLIVVAIIGVLVAISIPVFNGKLEAARESTDIANMRAAKAVLVTKYLNGENLNDDGYYYDAQKGTLETTKANIKPYGKGTEVDGGSEGFESYTFETKAKDEVLWLKGSVDKATGTNEDKAETLTITYDWNK